MGDLPKRHPRAHMALPVHKPGEKRRNSLLGIAAIQLEQRRNSMTEFRRNSINALEDIAQALNEIHEERRVWARQKLDDLQEWVREQEDEYVGVLFLSHLFRAFGQVIFLDNPLSGLIIFIALLIPEFKGTVYSFLAAISALVFTSQVLGLKMFVGPKRRNLGLFGFNAVLVGYAIIVFVPFEDSFRNCTLALVPIVGFAIFSVLIKMMLESLSRMPVLTYPFNGSLVVWLCFAYSIRWYKAEYIVSETAPEPFDEAQYYRELDFLKLCQGVLCGFSQVYLVECWLSGVFLFGAMLIHHASIACLALLGSATGALTALCVGAPLDHIYAGLYGFNPLLVFIVCGEILVNLQYLENWSVRYPIAFGVTLFTVPVQVCISRFLLPIHIPSMTLPFCFMGTLFLLIQRWVNIQLPKENVPDKNTQTTTKEDPKVIIE